MNLPDLLKITTFVLDMLTDIHHSLQKSSRESNFDCNPFCELDRRITSPHLAHSQSPKLNVTRKQSKKLFSN
jgi:hypothetical protein